MITNALLIACVSLVLVAAASLEVSLPDKVRTRGQRYDKCYNKLKMGYNVMITRLNMRYENHLSPVEPSLSHNMQIM